MSSRIEELSEQFLKSGLYLRGWSKTTLRTYRQGLSSFQQSLRECPLPVQNSDGTHGISILPKAQLEVSKQSLESWIISLKEKGLTPGGINMYIRTINSFLSWLESEQGLQIPRLKLLPNPSKPLQGFSDPEIRSLLSFRPRGFTELRTWTVINLLLDTGCRIEELLGCLKTSEVDFDNLLITVKGKGNKLRKVPISLESRKVLWRYVQKKHPGELLFCTRSGHRLSYRNTYRDIKALCAKAGVSGEHVHPHAFRHCFSCTYIRRGGDIYRLSRILGHTSISTTQIYLRSMGIEQIAENHSSLSPLNRN